MQFVGLSLFSCQILHLASRLSSKKGARKSLVVNNMVFVLELSV